MKIDIEDLKHWLVQMRDVSKITDPLQLDAMDTLIRAIDNDSTNEYERITRIWNDSKRFKEDSAFAKRKLTQLELVELTDTQRCVLDTLVKMMSEDNVVNICQRNLYEVFGFKNHETLTRNLSRLVNLGYIAKVSYEQLSKYSRIFTKQSGVVYMVNPSIATKRNNDASLKDMFVDIVGQVVSADFDKRLKSKVFVDSSITLATDVSKSRRLRINNIEPIYEPNKKTSVATVQSQADVSKSSKTIIANNTAVNQGGN